MTPATQESQGLQRVDVIKWIATAIQLIGCGLTGMGVTRRKIARLSWFVPVPSYCMSAGI